MSKISKLSSLPLGTTSQPGDIVILPNGREFVLNNSQQWIKKKSGEYLEDKGILTSENLNIITNQGIYHQLQNILATSANNYPTSSAGTLEVRFGIDAEIFQQYTVLAGQGSEDTIYTRGAYGGAWSAWKTGWNSSHFSWQQILNWNNLANSIGNYVTLDSPQNITGQKRFRSYGQHADYNSLWLYSDDLSGNPSITFNHGGVNYGQIKFSNAGFRFTDQNGAEGNQVLQAGAYAKFGRTDDYVLLAGGGDRLASDFLTNSNLIGYATEYWTSTNFIPKTHPVFNVTQSQINEFISTIGTFKPNVVTGGSINSLTGNVIFRSQGGTGHPTGGFGHATGIQFSENSNNNNYGGQILMSGEGLTFRYNSADSYASSIWKKVWTDFDFTKAYVDAWKNQTDAGVVLLPMLNNYLDKTSSQDVTGTKIFRNDSGSNDLFGTLPLRVLGSNGTRPGVMFYAAPDVMSSIQLDYSGIFHFTNTNDLTGYNQIKTGGFIKQGSNDNYVLLGGAGHKLISDFALSSSLGNYVLKSGDTMTGGLVTPHIFTDTIYSNNLNGSQILATVGDTMYFGNSGGLNYLNIQTLSDITHYKNGVPGLIWTAHNFNPASKSDTNHTHNSLYHNGGNTNIDIHSIYEDSKFKYSENHVAGSPNMFPTTVNANAIISIGKHPGNYGQLLGFNDVGEIFSANVYAGNWSAWRQLAYQDWVTTQITNLGIGNYVPFNGAQQNVHLNNKSLTGVNEFGANNGYLKNLFFENSPGAPTAPFPYVGFYMWGDEWQVNSRNFSNNYVHNLLNINTVSKLATFDGVVNSKKGFVRTNQNGSGYGNNNTRLSPVEYSAWSNSIIGAIIIELPNAEPFEEYFEIDIINGQHVNISQKLQLKVYGVYYNSAAYINDSGLINFLTKLRIAISPTGKRCIILNDIDYEWSYPHISVDKYIGGSRDAAIGEWNSSLVTDLTGYAIEHNVTINTALNTTIANDKYFNNYPIQYTDPSHNLNNIVKSGFYNTGHGAVNSGNYPISTPQDGSRMLLHFEAENIYTATQIQSERYSGNLVARVKSDGGWSGWRRHWADNDFTLADINGWKSIVSNQGNFVTTNTEQNIYKRKIFTGSTGNTYDTLGLEVQGNGASDTIYPGISFHQPGNYAASMYFRNGFHFVNINNTAYERIKTDGFIKNGFETDDWILVGSGNAINKNVFALATSLNNFVSKTGDTMTGNLYLSDKDLIDVKNIKMSSLLGVNAIQAAGDTLYLSNHSVATHILSNGDLYHNTTSGNYKIWTTQTLNPNNFVASKIYDGSYNANNLTTNSITYGYSVVNAPTSVANHSFSTLNLDTANPDYKMQIGFDLDTNEMFSRTKIGGTFQNWITYFNLEKNQDVTGRKRFMTIGGNEYSNNSLWIQSEDNSYPGITFQRNGINTAVINYDGGTFHFNNNGLSSAYSFIRVNGIYGHGLSDGYVWLAGGGNLSLNNLVKTNGTSYEIHFDGFENYLLKNGSIVGYLWNSTNFNPNLKADISWVNSTFLTQANANTSIAQLNADIAGKVSKSGDFMTGPLSISTSSDGFYVGTTGNVLNASFFNSSADVIIRMKSGANPFWDIRSNTLGAFTIENNSTLRVNIDSSANFNLYGTSLKFNGNTVWDSNNLIDYKTYGLGTTLPQVGNVNDQRVSGMYYAGYYTTGDLPFTFASILHMKYTDTEFAQIAVQHGGHNLAFRINGQGWKKVWTDLNFTQANIDSWNNIAGTYWPIWNDGNNKGFTSDSIFYFLTSGLLAQKIAVGGLVVSSNYSDRAFIPTNGIYSKGNIRTGEIVIAQNGFQNTQYFGGRNRIWSFANSDQYGLSYQQGGFLVGGVQYGEGINFHFGDSANFKMHINLDGTLYTRGQIITDNNGFSSQWNLGYLRSIVSTSYGHSTDGDTLYLNTQEGSQHTPTRNGFKVLDTRYTTLIGNPNADSNYFPLGHQGALANKVSSIFHTTSLYNGGDWATSLIIKGWSGSYKAARFTVPASSNDLEQDFYISQTKSSDGTWFVDRKIWTDKHFSQANIDSWNNNAQGSFVTTNTVQNIDAQKTFTQNLRVIGSNVNSNTTKLIIGNNSASSYWALSAGINLVVEDYLSFGTWDYNNNTFAAHFWIQNNNGLLVTNNYGTSANWKAAYDFSLIGATQTFVSSNYLSLASANSYLLRSGGSMSGMILFDNNLGGIQGTMADNDFWRVGGGNTGSNNGYLELATGDDGNEEIYVSQYAGQFSALTRRAKLLAADGNTYFPGNIYNRGQYHVWDSGHFTQSNIDSWNNISSNGLTTNTTQYISSEKTLGLNQTLYSRWSRADVANPNLGPFSLLNLALQSAYPMNGDEEFRLGNNSIGVYNNLGNGNVTLTRESVLNLPNRSGVQLRFNYNGGGASPAYGGFILPINPRPNAIYIQKFMAKLPIGRVFVNAENYQGDNSQVSWLTSQQGTGKWETYVRAVICGSGGGFANGGHVYVDGGPNSAFEFYLCFAEVYEINSSVYSKIKESFFAKGETIDFTNEAINPLIRAGNTDWQQRTLLSRGWDGTNGDYIQFQVPGSVNNTAAFLINQSGAIRWNGSLFVSNNLTGGQVFNASGNTLYFGNSALDNIHAETNNFRIYTNNGSFLKYIFDTVQFTTYGNINLVATSGDLPDIIFTDSGVEKHRIYEGAFTETLAYRKNGGTEFAILHSGNYQNYISGSFLTTDSTPQTKTGDLSLSSGANLRVNGPDSNWIRSFRNTTGDAGIVAGWEYVHYSTRWKVGNKRGGSTDSLGLGFEFSDNDGSTYTQKVLIQGDSNIVTTNFGHAAQWKTAFDRGDFRDFGLGVTDAIVPNDLDNITYSGIFGIHPSTSNRPTNYGGLLNMRHNTNEFTQLSVDLFDGRIYSRGKSNSSGSTGWIRQALYSELLGYQPLGDAFKNLIQISNLNLSTKSGIYRQEDPTSGYNYTTTLNLNSTDGRQQLTIERGGGGMKFRGTVYGSGDQGWSPWKTVLTTDDFTPGNYVPYNNANQPLVLGQHNLAHTHNGGTGKMENGVWTYNNVTQHSYNSQHTGTIALKVPLYADNTMLTLDISIYGYGENYSGNIKISFYLYQGAVYGGTGNNVLINTTQSFPSKIVRAGIDPSGKISICFGNNTSVWGSDFKIVVNRLTASYSGYNSAWNKDWESVLEDGSFNNYSSVTSFAITDTITDKGIQSISGLKTINRPQSVGPQFGLTIDKNSHSLLFEMGMGPSTSDNRGASIGFYNAESGGVMAGMYVKNNGQNGTHMAFATTQSFAAGPQVGITLDNNGIVDFPRGIPTIQGYAIATRQWVDDNYMTPQEVNNYIPDNSNWSGSTFINQRKVIGELAWRNYGNGHTIFDASSGYAPNGSVIDSQNSQTAWANTYPTLMGWNGYSTYGIRVDSSRVADALLGGYGHSGYINTDSGAQTKNGPLSLGSGLGMVSGQRIALKGLGDGSHYIKHFSSDDSVGFGINTKFAVKPYNDESINFFSVDGNGLTTMRNAEIKGRLRFNLTVLDLTGLDPNTYYPVRLSLPTNRFVQIRVVRTLDGGYGVPPYSTHGAGFMMNFAIDVMGHGWGTTDGQAYLKEYKTFWTNGSEIVGFTQMNNSSQAVVYLRGGSKYDFESDTENTPILTTSYYEIYGEVVQPTTTRVWERFTDTRVSNFVTKSGANEIITGKKQFVTTGDSYLNMALEVMSNNGASPGISFHKSGFYAGSIQMVNTEMFSFRNNPGSYVIDFQARTAYLSTFAAEGGEVFGEMYVGSKIYHSGSVHNSYNDYDHVLTSDGQARPISDFQGSGTNIKFQYVTSGEFTPPDEKDIHFNLVNDNNMKLYLENLSSTSYGMVITVTHRNSGCVTQIWRGGSQLSAFSNNKQHKFMYTPLGWQWIDDTNSTSWI